MADEFDPAEFASFKTTAPAAFDPNEFDQFKAAAAPSILSDVAKSGATGVLKGGISLAGLSGDARELMQKGVRWGADKLGVPGEDVAGSLDYLKYIPGPLSGPTSEKIRSGVTSLAGPLYKPQTTVGEYAQTFGEFLPGAALGPGSATRRLMTNAVAPALASETAGQATKWTELEPYSRIAGAVLGGAGASRLAGAPQFKSRVPSVDELKDAARAAYQHPEVAALEIKPSAVAAVGDDIAADLVKDGFRKRNAPQTFGIVEDELKTVPGATAKVADLDSVRRALNKTIGANVANPTEQEAARRAISSIDDYLAKIPSSDVLAGNAQNASRILGEARSNWGAARRAERFDEKLDAADLHASSTYSGGNLDNTTRQKLRVILTNKKLSRGYSKDELAEMERIVRGTFTGNSARFIGKVLGGGGGLGHLLTADVGMRTAGPAGFGLPLIGMVGRKIGTMSTTGRAAKLEEAIRARSQEAENWAQVTNRINAMLPTPMSNRTLAAMRATAATVPSRPFGPVDQSER